MDVGEIETVNGEAGVVIVLVLVGGTVVDGSVVCIVDGPVDCNMVVVEVPVDVDEVVGIDVVVETEVVVVIEVDVDVVVPDVGGANDTGRVVNAAMCWDWNTSINAIAAISNAPNLVLLRI